VRTHQDLPVDPSGIAAGAGFAGARSLTQQRSHTGKVEPPQAATFPV
jgi:hypothetical protein